jgi:hypothetical protein
MINNSINCSTNHYVLFLRMIAMKKERQASMNKKPQKSTQAKNSIQRKVLTLTLTRHVSYTNTVRVSHLALISKIGTKLHVRKRIRLEYTCACLKYQHATFAFCPLRDQEFTDCTREVSRHFELPSIVIAP